MKNNVSNISNISNVSQSYQFPNFNLSSMPNEANMNLSKPKDINFDNLNRIPNISNFTSNMINKTTSNTQKPVTIPINIQINQVNVNYRQAAIQRFGINTQSGPINLPLEKNK